MAATTQQLIALGNDGAFRQRVRALALYACATIYAEDPGTTSHSARVGLAYKILQTPSISDQFANFIVTRPALLNSAIVYNFGDGQVQTDATDSALINQLLADWNMLAGA